MICSVLGLDLHTPPVSDPTPSGTSALTEEFASCLFHIPLEGWRSSPLSGSTHFREQVGCHPCRLGSTVGAAYLGLTWAPSSRVPTGGGRWSPSPWSLESKSLEPELGELAVSQGLSSSARRPKLSHSRWLSAKGQTNERVEQNREPRNRPQEHGPVTFDKGARATQ